MFSQTIKEDTLLQLIFHPALHSTQRQAMGFLEGKLRCANTARDWANRVKASSSISRGVYAVVYYEKVNLIHIFIIWELLIYFG